MVRVATINVEKLHHFGVRCKLARRYGWRQCYIKTIRITRLSTQATPRWPKLDHELTSATLTLHLVQLHDRLTSFLCPAPSLPANNHLFPLFLSAGKFVGEVPFEFPTSKVGGFSLSMRHKVLPYVVVFPPVLASVCILRGNDKHAYVAFTAREKYEYGRKLAYF